ncbi:YkvA family protein [Paenibacillus koleovorans]|uniref:YkvA family protein n=1 Tax=Paenibacillus koleovorans TaxID=121608 RepID=UPI000FD851D8|nr:YkvA family protein [Paenibacillus koleovorans]
MLEKLRKWALRLKKQVFVLYFAYKDSRTPWYAKAFAVCVVAYAFSPIDLIPDFVPILGYLDDLILIPLGVALALKLLPSAVIQDCMEKAEARVQGGKPKNWLVGSLIIVAWLAVGVGGSVWVYRWLAG